MANKITTLEALNAIRDSVEESHAKFRISAMLCGGTGCHASGSRKLIGALREELDKQGLLEEIRLVETGCNGFCAMGW